jgi:catechol 2,3-dioxygenase-like lactoylglutathione lyase family enzyme
MTLPNDDTRAVSPESGPSSSAGKLAFVDLEAGRARARLRPGPPVNARRMDHVNMSVRDLDVSAAFYAALFGLEVKEEGKSGEQRWCIIGSPDRVYICLFEVPGAEGFKAEDIHMNHVGFVVDDIDETLNRIRALGVRLVMGDKTLDWPRSRSAYVTDSDIIIEITNRLGGGPDSRATQSRRIFERQLGHDLLQRVASHRRSLTSSEVAARAVSPTSRFFPASRKSFDQR